MRNLAALVLLVLAVPARAQFKTAAPTGETLSARAVLETHDATGGFVFSADGATVWLAAGRKAMQFEVATAKLLRTIDYHSADNPDWHMGQITAMVASHDGALIASGDRDGNIKLWDPATGKVVGAIPTVSQGSPVRSLSFDAADATLVSVNRSQHIFLWDVKARRKKATLDTGDNSTFERARYTGDGKRLVTIDNTGRIRVYAGASGALEATFTAGTKKAGANVFVSGDGRLLAVNGADARILDASSGKLKLTLAHGADVAAVAFSHDGKWIATCGADKTAKLWNAASGAIKATFEGHPGGVNTVAFSPDDRTLITGGEGEGRLWDLPR